MITGLHPNIEMIKIIAQRLGDLVNEVAFLGGATTGLLITDPGVAELRPTKDVDVIIEIFSRIEFQNPALALKPNPQRIKTKFLYSLSNQPDFKTFLLD